MLLQDAKWPAVERYLQHSTAILVPIGAIEQHGPTGIMGTDAICAEAIARKVGNIANTMVAPTIFVGMSVHHMEFAGSMSLRPSTYILLLHDYILSLRKHGFREFVFVNGHGGNIPCTLAAFYEVHATISGIYAANESTGELSLKLVNWWQMPEVAKYVRQEFGASEGLHATVSEVSLTQFLLPHTSEQQQFTIRNAPCREFGGPKDFRARHPDGRVGSNPNLATPDIGQHVLQIAADNLVEILQNYIRDRVKGTTDAS